MTTPAGEDRPLVDRVRRALAGIKHRKDCSVLLEGDACCCDREERMAQAVAEAIEAASYDVPNRPPIDWRIENAVAALGPSGAPR